MHDTIVIGSLKQTTSGLVMSQVPYSRVVAPGSIGGGNPDSGSLPPGSVSLPGTPPLKTSRPVVRRRSISMSAIYLMQVGTCVTPVQPTCRTA